MRFAHIIRDLELASGGPSRSIPQLVEALDLLPLEGEWAQHLVFGDRGRPNAPIKPTANVHVHGVTEGLSGTSTGGLARELRHIHSQTPLQLIHVHGLWSPTLHSVIRWARQTRVPYVVSPRGMLSAWCFNHKRLKKRIGWWLYQRSDLQRAAAVHVTSEEEKSDVESLGIRSPIVVVPNGANLNTNLRGLQDKPTRLALCITRLHPVKGLDMLIDAWSSLRPADWKLIIAGPSEEGMRERLKAQIAKLELSGQVELQGEVDDAAKSKLFAQSDLFVLPSQSENFGMSIAESLAIGVPVVTTTGTPWSDVSTYNCGWIVPPQSTDLTKALRQALSTQPADLFEMGQRGRQLILDKFTWPAVAMRMRTAYQSLIKTGTPAPSMDPRTSRVAGTVNTIQ